MSMSSRVCVAVAGALFASTAASAVTLRFGGVSKNNESNTSDGEQQLTIDVFSPTTGPVREGNFIGFLIENPGPAQSTITQIYFDDGTILGLATILDDPENGVDFEQYPNPADRPGGNELDPPFEATQAFSVGNEPGRANGIDVGESLTLIFELLPGLDFEDTLQALVDGTLRIGMHVQGFADGGSESFVNLPPEFDVVPLPGPAGLAIVGLGAVAARRRRA
ncbi:MAG: hypothetical protein ACF8QF_13900 [Phycisphaerales bacterium]